MEKRRGQTVLNPIERIKRLSEIDVKTGCWNWKGGLKGPEKLKRYGRLIVGSRVDGSRKGISAHRYSYQIFVGKIPDGLWVLHHCDNPSCVNPDHLFLGDRMDNTRDRDSKGRNKVLCGEDNPSSVLTQDEVQSIRREFRPYVVTRRFLAEKYGVSDWTIKEVLSGRSWKHLLPPPPTNPAQTAKETPVVPCPNCEGLGDLANIGLANIGLPHKTCDICDGTGKVANPAQREGS